MPAYGKSRDTNESEIVGVLKQVGATVYRLHTPVDLLVGYRGANYLLEVKRPLGPKGGKRGSKLTDDQVEFFRSWNGQRAEVRHASDALVAIGALTKEQARIYTERIQ